MWWGKRCVVDVGRCRFNWVGVGVAGEFVVTGGGDYSIGHR